MSWIYHEKQEAKLCAQHCLNNLLQLSIFSPHDLAQLAHEFDEEETRLMMTQGTDTNEALRYLAEGSGNVDESGNFSLQVIEKALLNYDNIQLVLYNQLHVDATSKQGFIIHRNDHWFAIRRVDSSFWNLDSLQKRPVLVSSFYLSAFLAQLDSEGYSVFVVITEADKTLPESYGPDVAGDDDYWRVSELTANQGKSEVKKSEVSAFQGEGRTMGGDEDSDLDYAIAMSLQTEPMSAKELMRAKRLAALENRL